MNSHGVGATGLWLCVMVAKGSRVLQRCDMTCNDMTQNNNQRKKKEGKEKQNLSVGQRSVAQPGDSVTWHIVATWAQCGLAQWGHVSWRHGGRMGPSIVLLGLGWGVQIPQDLCGVVSKDLKWQGGTYRACGAMWCGTTW
jgi:hypothetical protein